MVLAPMLFELSAILSCSILLFHGIQGGPPCISVSEVTSALENVQSDVMRRLILRDGLRVDGRTVGDLRAITAESRPLQARSSSS